MKLKKKNPVPLFKPTYLDTLFSIEGSEESWSKNKNAPKEMILSMAQKQDRIEDYDL